jgi:hypothetical protein
MKGVVLAIALTAFSAQATAASCVAESAEKKLAGAAKTSFLKKCEADAKATCEASAKDKKLSGAAQASFVKKCLADAVGSYTPAKVAWGKTPTGSATFPPVTASSSPLAPQ